MRFGLIILPIERWSVQADQWRRAESYGFDHAWTYDHLTWDPLAGTPWGATMPTLVAAAGVTSQIPLGTWVTSPNFRHPVTFAREIAALDDVSNGRAMVGIGAGTIGSDARVLGEALLPAADRAERLEEFVDLLDAVLTQQVTDHQGRFYTADEALTTQPCVQRPRPPVLVAAGGPRLMRLAARLDGWISNGSAAADDAADDETWWRDLAGFTRRFEDVAAAAGADPAAIPKYLSVDAAPTFSLTSVEVFRDVVGRASQLGYTDVVAHWPLPGAAKYNAPESMLEAIAAELDGLRS